MRVEAFMFEIGHLEANLHLAGDPGSGRGFLVDAGAFGEVVLARAAEIGLRIEAILITHLHHDHIDGLGAYMERLPGTRVWSPAPLAAAPGAKIVMHGDRISVCGYDFDVIRTSGHTPESVSYSCASEKVCFVGDAIFAGAVGGTSSDELHAEELGHLRSGIMTLAPDTGLFSGHGPATTVAIERRANPFLQPGFTRLP